MKTYLLILLLVCKILFCTTTLEKKGVEVKSSKWGRIIEDKELIQTLLEKAVEKRLIRYINYDEITYNLIESDNYYLIEIIPNESDGGGKQLKIDKRSIDEMTIEELHLPAIELKKR